MRGGSVAALVGADLSFAPDGPPVIAAGAGAAAHVVAVVGPQASGKSTLANALFGTAFPVAPRGAVGAATTRGVDLAEAEAAARTPGGAALLVMDVEGSDARARGRAGRAFQARAAALAAGLADAVLLNLWFHDAARGADGAGHGLLLRAVLAAAARAVVAGAADRGGDGPPRAALVFVVRDVDDDADDAEVVDVLLSDAADMWERVAVAAGLQPGMMALEEAVDLSVVLLPHIRHHAEAWREGVAELRDRLAAGGDLVDEDHSKGIPPEDFAVVAGALWESLGFVAGGCGGGGGGGYGSGGYGSGGGGGYGSPGDAALSDEGGGIGGGDADYYSGEDLVIVAAYRCDEVFSALLADASGEVADLHDRVDGGATVDGLGAACGRVIARALQRYEADAADFADEPVFERKRRELEAILDTGLNAVYLRQLHNLRERAVKSFSHSLDGERPADAAIFAADAAFVAAAEDARRPASPAPWSYDTERADLRAMLAEIAAQRRKLVATQVSAGAQQSQAIQYLQMQHAQMRAVQQQALGGNVGQWSLGAAYRPPDSNVNVSVGFQQGRTNLQISMVPDESASLLGPNGFTSGVGRGNLGLSFNLNA